MLLQNFKVDCTYYENIGKRSYLCLEVLTVMLVHALEPLKPEYSLCFLLNTCTILQ